MLITEKKYILVLGEGTTDGLDYATIIEEAKYFINCQDAESHLLLVFILLALNK